MATLPFTASPIISAWYHPHVAEDGKFIALDSNTITGYAALSGAGRYAVLTYDLNAGAVSSGTSTVSGSMSISQATPGTTNRVVIADQFNSIVSVSSAVSDNFSLTANRLRVVAALKTLNVNGTSLDIVRSGIQSDTSLSATGYINTLVATGTVAGAILTGSSAFENARIIKQSAGTLISLIGYNSKATVQFIQLHNTATIPADTAIPICTITVAPSSNFSIDVPIAGMPFTTGITVCNSTNAPGKTLGAADCFFTATFK